MFKTLFFRSHTGRFCCIFCSAPYPYESEESVRRHLKKKHMQEIKEAVKKSWSKS